LIFAIFTQSIFSGALGIGVALVAVPVLSLSLTDVVPEGGFEAPELQGTFPAAKSRAERPAFGL